MRVFVYGTLKAGFPNFHINRGRRVPGRFVTSRPMALIVVGDDHVPWLIDAARFGDTPAERVEGEVYDVAEPDVPIMDALEDIGRPGGYRRVAIDVKDVESGAVQTVQVYLQDLAHLAGRAIHAGPLAVYTSALAAKYRQGDST